jgi:hypothetical protein
MKPAVSLQSRSRIPDGVLHQPLQDELVLLNLQTGVYFGLNAVGARVWQLIQASPDAPLQQVLDTLMGEFDVASDRCAQDLLALVARLQENRLLEITG